MPRRRLLVLLVTLLALGASCSDGSGAGRAKATEAPKPPLTYVAVGASETVGTGADKPETQAWPRVLADRLGEGGRKVSFTSVGYGGATTADAIVSAVPKAEQAQPNLVTVWLNVNDLVGEFIFQSPTSYEQRLDELVRRLRRGGATTVLVANTPALDELPLYRGCLGPTSACLLPSNVRDKVPQPDVLNAKVDTYNEAIARVTTKEGAVLVDLHAASLKARADGSAASLVSADGFHPSTAGHAAVAATFLEAARKANV